MTKTSFKLAQDFSKDFTDFRFGVSDNQDFIVYIKFNKKSREVSFLIQQDNLGRFCIKKNKGLINFNETMTKELKIFIKNN